MSGGRKGSPGNFQRLAGKVEAAVQGATASSSPLGFLSPQAWRPSGPRSDTLPSRATFSWRGQREHQRQKEGVPSVGSGIPSRPGKAASQYLSGALVKPKGLDQGSAATVHSGAKGGWRVSAWVPRPLPFLSTDLTVARGPESGWLATGLSDRIKGFRKNLKGMKS